MKKIPIVTDTFSIALGRPFPEKQIIDVGYFENRHIKKRFILLVQEWSLINIYNGLDDENVESWFKW